MIIHILKFRFFEYFAKLTYLKFKKNKFLYRIKKIFFNDKKTGCENINISVIDLLGFFKSNNFHSTDNVVIHSGLNGVNLVESDDRVVREICNFFSEGSVSMPTIPLARYNSNEDEYEVNFNKARSSTGRLSNALIKLTGSIRSLMPLNNITTYGANADYIISNHHFQLQKSPCDINSPWFRLFNLNAKIIFFNVFPTHAMTMIHVAEESYIDKFPISAEKWFDKKRFNIIDRYGNEHKRIFRERYHHWSIHYSEKKLYDDLIKKNILKKYHINGLQLHTCDSKSLIEFLLSMRPSSYPYFLVDLEFGHE